VCKWSRLYSRQDELHYSPPNSFPRLWEQRNGPTLIRPQRRGGYIGPADTVSHKARQGIVCIVSCVIWVCVSFFPEIDNGSYGSGRSSLASSRNSRRRLVSDWNNRVENMWPHFHTVVCFLPRTCVWTMNNHCWMLNYINSLDTFIIFTLFYFISEEVNSSCHNISKIIKIVFQWICVVCFSLWVHSDTAGCCFRSYRWSTAMHQFKWKKRGSLLKRWTIQDCANSHCHPLVNQLICMYSGKTLVYYFFEISD